MVIKMSFWEKELNRQNLESVQGDLEIDTLIIGGGLAGLSTLYYLKDQSSVCLVDRGKIGSGITKNTTGKITYLQETIYSDLEKNLGLDIAREYLKSQKYAIDLLKNIVIKEKVDCHLEQVESYLFASTNKEIKKVKKEKEFLESQNCKVKEHALPISLPSFYALSVSDTFVFHPILFINFLKEKLKNKIYEKTLITKIEFTNGKYICRSDNGTIKANKVIVTCHYPFFFIPFCLPLKSHIEKSHIIVRKVKTNPKFSCINSKIPTLSVRYYEDKTGIYQICLAKSHKTSTEQNDIENFKDVKKIYNIKNDEIISSWTNVDIITDDQLPFIGKVKKNFYIATGFNTWGMTNCVLSGYMLSREILGEDVPFQKLFLPKRNDFYQIKSFFGNTFNSAKSFIGSKKLNKYWYQKNIVFAKKNGKSIAIFTDKEGIKHIVYTTCPHMGCSLIFNELEETWDCPCHSSRFNIDGKCIKGPSTKNISCKDDV